MSNDWLKNCKLGGVKKAQTEVVKPEQAMSKTTEVSASTQVATKPVSQLKAALAGIKQTSTIKPASVLAAALKSTPKSPAVSQQKKAQINSVEDIGDIDLDNLETRSSNYTNYVYAEQADACDDATTRKFYELMHELINSMNAPYLINSLRETRAYLQENPELKSILKPTDIQLLVRGLRISYGKALAVRTSNVKKRSEKQESVDALVGELDSITF